MSSLLRTYGLVALIITFAAYYAVLWLTNLDRYLAGVAATSLTTFLFYGWDKLLAKSLQHKARRRVPENLLHLLALIGGFPGGWAGMFIFWHKVRKPVFWIVLGVSTVLHLALYVSFYGF